jgi:hypothetical protein
VLLAQVLKLLMLLKVLLLLEVLGAIEARGTGDAVRSLTLNYLMNRSGLGIAAETYATVYEREYNKLL